MVPTLESFSLPVISFTSPTVADDIRAACLIIKVGSVSMKMQKH